MKKNIVMPKLSPDMDKGVLVAWNKQPGDSVEAGEVLFEIETDKVISEVESTEKGVLKEAFFEEGDEVPVNEVVAVLESKNA